MRTFEKMDKRNPCDICMKEECEDCVLNIIYSKKYQCNASKCFLNYEGTCNISIYDVCGCAASYEYSEE